VDVRRFAVFASIALPVMTMASCAKPTGAVTMAASVHVTALTVTMAPLAPLGVPYYSTRGSFPQVSGGSAPLTATNSALRQIVLSDEEQFAVSARKHAQIPGIPMGPGLGLYQMTPQRQLISASSVVVSALVPTLMYYPGGTPNATWLSETVEVPSGKSLSLSDLFTDPSAALKAIATASRTKLLASNSGLKSQLEYLQKTHQVFGGFAPTRGNYQYFALLRSGLAVGFPAYQLLGPGRTELVIPYTVIRPYLNRLGARMLAGVQT
jgi:hypothetical protein